MVDSSEQSESLDKLERQAERSRAELVDTVDQLRSRVSPDSVKDDVRQYVSRTTHDMVESLELAAREHPLQAVAIGAGLAYPAWRLVSSVPIPVLLLGAGVALAGRSSGTKRGHSGSPVNRGVAGEGFKASLQDAAARAKQQLGAAVESAEAAVTSGFHSVTAGLDDARRSAAEAASSVASAASSTVSEAASSSYRSSAHAASFAGEQAAYAGRQTRDGIRDAVERYPFLVGGIGLLIGAALAASLPRTETENRLLGETSDEVRNRAREGVAQGYDAAKEAGERIFENTLQAADEEGLSVEGARDAAHELGDKVRAVATRAAAVSGGSAQDASTGASTHKDNS